MKPTKTQQRKLKSRYFERSLRFPIAIFYFIIFMVVLFQNIYFNFGLSYLSTRQWIILGSGFFVLISLEVIEWLVYPKKPYFLLALYLTGIRIIVYYFILISDPTGVTSSIIGYLLFTLCFYVSPMFVLPILLVVLFVFYQDIGHFRIWKNINVGYLYELFSIVMFYLLGVIIRLDDRTRLNNQRMINQLEIYALNSVSLGKEEERNRISRDLHDSLGHQLIAVNLQLQKAVAYRDLDAEESLESIRKAQEATNEAIKDLRQTIKDLREFEEKSSFVEKIDSTVQRVRENGLEVSTRVSGSPEGYPEVTLMTLTQIIQEGMTNIEKHADASEVVLDIQFSRKKVVVEIKDDGVGFNYKKVKKGDHFGLLGMQERLEVIGGKLKIRSKPTSGTVLKIEVPKGIYGQAGG